MGVLVAVSIPIFTSQLEKSRDAVSIANIRAAYAEAQTAILSSSKAGDECGNATIGTGFDFGKISGTVEVTGLNIKSLSANDWSGLDAELPWDTSEHTTPADGGAVADDVTITFTYTNGEITAVSYK